MIDDTLDTMQQRISDAPSIRDEKKEELKELSKTVNLESKIRWKWAFRYQWIIKTV